MTMKRNRVRAKGSAGPARHLDAVDRVSVPGVLRLLLLGLLMLATVPCWASWPTGFGGIQDDDVADIAVSPSTGNIYAVGDYRGVADFGPHRLTSESASHDIFVVKLDPGGEVLWATTAGGKDTDIGSAIAVDSSDGIYVTGSFTNWATFGSTTLTARGNEDGFVAKLNHDGGWEWARGMGGIHNDVADGVAVFESSSGSESSVFVAGRHRCTAYFDGPDGSPLEIDSAETCQASQRKDAFLARLGLSGDWIWVTDLNELLEQGYGDNPPEVGIVADPDGNVFLSLPFWKDSPFPPPTQSPWHREGDEYT